MVLKLGSASLSERGTVNGRKGDQTGREVKIQNYYLHKNGWRVFRATSSQAASKISYAMRAICNNDNFGYGQKDRLSGYTELQKVGFDPRKVTTKCNLDCSESVRASCAYAGIKLPDFYTGNEASVLLKSGKFHEVTSSINMKTGAGLLPGDILVTKTKGHTVIALGGEATVNTTNKVGDEGMKTVKLNDKNRDVMTLQAILHSKFGYSNTGHPNDVGAIDGDFGRKTDICVRDFQKNSGLKVDGIVGNTTWNKLLH